MTTLGDIAKRTWRALGHSRTITATGGSTTTIVDSNSIYTTDGAMLNGTAVVIWDAGGAGAAPEGEFSAITGYTASSKTFAINAVTAAIASGDRIDLAKPTINLAQMIQFVNDGLHALGYINKLDTSVTTAADKTEYTLPVALKTTDLVDVLLQTELNDSDDNRYVSIKGGCRVETAAPGSTGLIYLPQLTAGYTVKIIYNGYHPTVTAATSTIWEAIPEQLAAAATLDQALTWLVSKKGNAALGGFLIQRWQDAKQMLMNAKIESPMYKARVKPRYFTVG